MDRKRTVISWKFVMSDISSCIQQLDNLHKTKQKNVTSHFRTLGSLIEILVGSDEDDGASDT